MTATTIKKPDVPMFARDDDPPIYVEAHQAIVRRWKRKKWACPELTMWITVAALRELSDADRATAKFDAVNAVNHGWSMQAAA